MLQSPKPRQTKVLLGAARVRTGPVLVFFVRGTASSGPKDELAASGDAERAFAAAPGGVVADGGVEGASSCFIASRWRWRWYLVCLTLVAFERLHFGQHVTVPGHLDRGLISGVSTPHTASTMPTTASFYSLSVVVAHSLFPR